MFTVRFIEGGQIERDNRADCACDDLLAGRQDRRAQQSRDAMRCAAKDVPFGTKLSSIILVATTCAAVRYAGRWLSLVEQTARLMTGSGLPVPDF
jgi:hypothetical protein